MKKALLLLAMVLTGVAGHAPTACGAAGTLELTDSGAPSAIVIFPVGERPNPEAAAMAPVTFNHVIHEKWMDKAGKDCVVCHHTGDAVACTECHTVEGSAKAKFKTLETAMHAPTIRPRKDKPTPSSCVSCHISQTQQRNCAGCHQTLVRGAREKEEWCVVCHTAPRDMTKEQMQLGIANRLPAGQNEKLATQAALDRKKAAYWSPMVAPYKVKIDALSQGNALQGSFGPCNFNHRHHAASMMERIETSKLAGAFHTQPATICVTCHHNSPASATPPKCGSCHGKTLDWLTPARPNLMAAFHLQCMSCHKDMKVARPRSTDCQTCHKPLPVSAASK